MNDSITVEKVINHAARRCGVTTPTLEPEQLDMAKNNLMFTLLDLNNRGVPIYQVEQMLLGFTPNTWEYTLSRDVYDITNVNWRQLNKVEVLATGGIDPEFINDTDWHSYGITTDQFTITSNVEQWISGYGINFFDNNFVAFDIEYSLDDIEWTVYKSYPLASYANQQWIWVDIETPLYGVSLRIRLTEGDELKLRSFQMLNNNSIYEVVASRMNRDDFMSLPQKGIIGSPWNWYFQKTIDPVLMTWQSLPESQCFNGLYHMYYIQAPVYEKMSLPTRLQVPLWYVDAIIWTLASKMAWELPNATPERVQVLEAKASQAMNQAEAANADMGPINVLGAVVSQYQRLK